MHIRVLALSSILTKTYLLIFSLHDIAGSPKYEQFHRLNTTQILHPLDKNCVGKQRQQILLCVAYLASS